ncbi:MAG: hypothetical protein AMXMBFR53_01350 [Gemmatimonadota bacterium]
MSRPHFRPGLALSLAFRGLVRDPGSSLLAVAILALGIAAPATFFSFLVGAGRPLPVPEGDRVVRVDVVQPSRGGQALPVTMDDLALLQGSAGLAALGGFQVTDGTLVDRDRAAARFSGAVLTPEVLPLLRVAPSLGRVPAPGEAASTVLLGHDLWEELYAGDPAAVGRTVEVNGVARSIVGVMPDGFGFPFKQNGWIVAGPGFQGEVELVGRLAAGATPEGVTTEVAARWLLGDAARDPASGGGVAVVKRYTGGRGERGEAVAFGGLVLVGLCLLLIACANVANLLLVRATERVRALGVQAALGAGRAQIGAQLLLESLLVAAGGGAAGLLLASAAVGAVQRGLSEEHFGYFWMRLAVDGPVLLFVGGLVVATALVAGLLPAVRVAGVDVQRVLKEEGAGTGVGGGGAWSRVFVTLQLALSCGALVAAGLTGQSLAGSRSFGDALPGDELLLASVDLRDPATGALPDGRVDALEAALASLPGAAGSALARGAPGYREPYSPVETEGAGGPAPGAPPRTGWNGVTPGYFGALGLEIRAGRGIEGTDGPGAGPVAVVSESFARAFSPDAPALGRRIRLAQADSATWWTVVGVVADAPLGGGRLMRDDRVYVPLRQLPAREVMILVRARGDVTGLAPEVRRAAASVSPEMAVWDVRTLSDAHAYLIRVPRALASMALAGGAAGLLVAAVGLYGLLAFRVRQRRRELGIRLALGADGTRLAREVLTLAGSQIAPAVAVGLVLAWVASPVLGAFLLGLDPRAPGVYLGVAVAFVTTGMVAALVPAARAAAVDPARVLRGE